MNAVHSLAHKRFEAFWKKCKNNCSSQKVFRKSFDIAGGHINKGILKDPLRYSLGHEDMAAIISQGQIKLENCSEKPFFEIAVDGKILNYEWTEFGKQIQVHLEEAIHARVVIREGSNRDIIITIYAWPCSKNDNLSEVNREHW